MKFHTLNPKDYEDRLIQHLKVAETNNGHADLQPYLDSKGNPSIGIGFNLTTRSAFDEVALSLMPDITGQEQNELRQFCADYKPINGNRAEKDKAFQEAINQKMEELHEKNKLLPTTFEYKNEAEADQTLLKILGTYEVKVDNWLGFDVPKSMERVALVSLAFNTLDGGTSLLGPSLKAALMEGDRPEAWYEIRYGSNGDDLDGIAIRRYAESSLFGLYNDPHNITNLDRLEVEDMQRNHDDAIASYDSAYGELIDEAQEKFGDYVLSTSDAIVGKIVESPKEAKGEEPKDQPSEHDAYLLDRMNESYDRYHTHPSIDHEADSHRGEQHSGNEGVEIPVFQPASAEHPATAEEMREVREHELEQAFSSLRFLDEESLHEVVTMIRRQEEETGRILNEEGLLELGKDIAGAYIQESGNEGWLMSFEVPQFLSELGHVHGGLEALGIYMDQVTTLVDQTVLGDNIVREDQELFAMEAERDELVAWVEGYNRSVDEANEEMERQEEEMQAYEAELDTWHDQMEDVARHNELVLAEEYELAEQAKAEAEAEAARKEPPSPDTSDDVGPGMQLEMV